MKITIRHKTIVLGSMVLIVIICFLIFISFYGTDDITTTLNDVERVDGVWLVNTADGPFRLADGYRPWRWDSGTVASKAKGWVGQKVHIYKYGWRVGWFSWTENIISIRPLKMPSNNLWVITKQTANTVTVDKDKISITISVREK
jgi:hypothetical protein